MKKCLLMIGVISSILIGCRILGAQTEEISRYEFAKAISSTTDIFAKTPIRSTLDHKIVLFGSLSREIIQVVELVGTNKTRRKETFHVTGKSPLIREYIEIGSSNYCRLNDGPWKRSADDCNPMFVGLMAPDDSVMDKFTVSSTVLNGRPVKMYEHYQTFKRGIMHTFDDKLWINAQGERVRGERRSGLVDDTDNYEAEVEIIEYQPKGLTVVAPRPGRARK
jgi:hypothetical protein